MKLAKIIKEKGITTYRLARMAEIAPSDLYCVLKNQKPCYPAWRSRISKALGMNEKDVFPEYHNKEQANGTDDT